MTTETTLAFEPGMYDALFRHLLPPDSECEEAAFGFATTSLQNNRLAFNLVSLFLVPPEGFEERSPLFLHLNDETRGKVIKRAHDLDASLVEFHSHPSQLDAEFSPSDCFGFKEFVPHVTWRLKGKPYAAFVFSRHSFDALAWHTDPHKPVSVHHLSADGQLLYPTGLTLNNQNSRRRYERH